MANRLSTKVAEDPREAPKSRLSQLAANTAKAEEDLHMDEYKEMGLLDLQREVIIKARPLSQGPAKEGEKVVHLFRHGQGFHNMMADLWLFFGQEVDLKDPANPYNKAELLDPPLTAKGRDQAKALQERTAALKNVQLVVTSPMRRAVETSLLAFNHLVRLKGNEPGSTSVGFLAREELHEQGHGNLADKRRDLADIKPDFPMVDFNDIYSESDPIFKPQEYEPSKSVSDRGYSFMLWFATRPETEIGVGTHSAWLFALINTVLKCSEPEMTKWFSTGEMRSFVLTFE